MGRVGQKYPIRIQLNVSEEMDDNLSDMADLMGITKTEYIRFIVGQALMGQKQAVEMMRDEVMKQGQEEAPGAHA